MPIVWQKTYEPGEKEGGWVGRMVPPTSGSQVKPQPPDGEDAKPAQEVTGDDSGESRGADEET